MPPWDWILGAVIGGAVSAALGIWWARAHREPWPELDELADRSTRLEHRQKMLQGRLNSIAPPREGTGSNGDDRVPLAGTGAAGEGLSRAAVLARYHRARRKETDAADQ